MKPCGPFVALLLACASAAWATAHGATPKVKIIIIIKIDQTELSATLDDNATTRSFVALLPLELELEDYNATEKIAYPPKKLSTEGAPAGIDPSVGDVTYYAPWGNLALFYRDFGYSPGLIKLGRHESGIEALRVRGTLKVRVELVQQP